MSYGAVPRFTPRVSTSIAIPNSPLNAHFQEMIAPFCVRLEWNKILEFVRLEWYDSRIMILSDRSITTFRKISAQVGGTMVRHGSRTPYLVDHPLIQAYECLRLAWLKREPIRNACAKYGLSRSSYYEYERCFVEHGVAGLFPEPNGVTQRPALERLVLMAKRARPSLGVQALLRVAQAVPLTRAEADLDTLSQVLKSHGLSPSAQASDAAFFGRLQRMLDYLARLKQQRIAGRDPHGRPESFFAAEDGCQRHLELLRELFYAPKAKAGEVCARHGVARTTYYRLVEAYRAYGPWGVIGSPLPGKEGLSEELQLNVILTKLRHPRFSAQDVVEALKLRCSRFQVHRILQQWELTDKNRQPVALDEYAAPERDAPAEPVRSAWHSHTEEDLLERYRINRHFELICRKMQHHPYHLCDPGPLLLAPFVSDLAVVQSFESYGPQRLRGRDLTNLALLNVFRILAGYRRINHLSDHRDHSVALASGLGLFGSTSRFYEDTVAFTFEHLHPMRLDLVARAKELNLIDGTRLACDFHFKEFYGRFAEEKQIGHGPNKAGQLVPGFRPHVAWDLVNNVLVTMAYFQGAARGPRVLRSFCREHLFAVLDPLAIEELYLDSEYTKESDLGYLTQELCPNGEVYICLKQNKQIEKLIAPALAAGDWTPHDDHDERKSLDVTLPHSGLPMRIVLLRDRESKEHVRCFGTTDTTVTEAELLHKYPYRWLVENGLKDLVGSYFLDEVYGADPQKIEFEFYCVMVARLAYEYFLKELGEPYHIRADGNKYTLATMRTLLLEKQNCKVHQDEDGDLVITLLDGGTDKLVNDVSAMLKRLHDRGRNKVLWWGNRGVKLRQVKQFASS